MSVVYLPPQMDSAVHHYSGTLTLTIGNLVTLNLPKHENLKLRVCFWGQEKLLSDQVVLKLQESLLDFPTSQQYTLCVDKTRFEKYLAQSKKVHLFLLDHRNDKQVGQIDYLLNNTLGEQICQIQRGQENIGQLAISLSVSFQDKPEESKVVSEKQWSHSYDTQDFKSQVEDLESIHSIAQSIKDQLTKDEQVKPKENDIDDKHHDNLFDEVNRISQILKLGAKIHEKLMVDHGDQPDPAPKTVSFPKQPQQNQQRPPLVFPELQTLSNDVDLIKLTQTDTTAKKKIQQNIQEEPGQGSANLRVESLNFTNDNAFQYIQDKSVSLRCLFPNQSTYDTPPQVQGGANNSLSFSSLLPYQLDTSQDQQNAKITFKLINAQDQRELASGELKLNTLSSPLKSNLRLPMSSQVPFDRLQNPSPNTPQASPQNMQKIEQNSFIGELALSFAYNKNKQQNQQQNQVPPTPQVQNQLLQNGTLLQSLLVVKPVKLPEGCSLRYLPFAPPALVCDIPHRKILPLPQEKPRFLLIEIWQSKDLLAVHRLMIPKNLNIEGKLGMIVEDDEVDVSSMEGQVVGQVHLTWVIGTVAQMHAWEKKLDLQAKDDQNVLLLQKQQLEKERNDQKNEQERLRKEQELKESIEVVRQIPEQTKQSQLKPNIDFDRFRNESQVEGSPLQGLITWFEEVRRINKKQASKVTYMLTSDDILSEDKFVEFVKSFGIELSDARIGQFLRIFDYHHECEVDMKELGAAYSAYFKYEGQVRDQYESLFREVLQLIPGGSRSIKGLFQKFNDLLIDKAQFQEVLSKKLVDQQCIEKLQTLLVLPDQNNLIFYPQFWEYPRQLELHSELKYLQPNCLIYIDYYQHSNDFTPVELTDQQDLTDIQLMLKNQQLSHSKLDALLLLNNIQQAMLGDMKVEAQDLMDFLKNRPLKESQVFTVHDHDDMDEINDLLNQKHQLHESSVSGVYQKNLMDNSNSDIHFSMKNDKNQKNPSDLVESNIIASYYPQPEEPKVPVKQEDSTFSYLNHHFKIKVRKVYDYSPQSATATLTYQFPTFTPTVATAPFTLNGADPIVLNSVSRHQVTLPKAQHPKSLFNVKGIPLFLTQKGSSAQGILAQSFIPMGDLLDLLSDIDFQTLTKKKAKANYRYVLYDRQQEPFGLVSVGLSYNCEPEYQSVIMQKEITTLKYLPKEGWLGVKLESMHYIKGVVQGWTHVRVDMFGQNKSLNAFIVKSQKREQETVYEMNEEFGQVLKLNESVLEYFQHSYALVQFVNDTQYSTEVLGSAKIPLIEIITNLDGVFGEYPIFQGDSIFVGSIKLHIKYDSQPAFSQGPLLSKSANVILSFQSLLNYLQNEPAFIKESQDKQLMYFQWNHQNKRFLTPTFILQRDQKSLSFQDFSFLLSVEDLKQATSDLEIKLYVKNNKGTESDQLFAFAKLDLAQLVSQSEKQYKYQSYFTMIGATASLPIKCRLGLTLIVFPCLYSELSSQTDFLDSIMDKPVGQYSNKEKIQAQKIAFDQSEIQFTVRYDMIEISGQKLLQSLYKEFCFYDYHNSGFIDPDDAKRIAIMYEDKIQKMSSPVLAQFEYSNKFDYHQKQHHLGQEFDILQFMQILKLTEPIKTIQTPKSFVCVIKRGINFQNLNHNIPPNSFLLLNDKKTEIKIRAQNPYFNETVTFGQKLEVKVGHSMYSRQKMESIRQETFLGELSIIPTKAGDFTQEFIVEGQRTNAYLEFTIQGNAEEDQPEEENLESVYDNIEKTLRELNTDQQRVQVESQPLQRPPIKIKTQQQMTFQSGNNLFGSTLEKLTQLNLDLEGQNMNSMGSFSMEKMDKFPQQTNQKNPFQNHIKLSKDKYDNSGRYDNNCDNDYDKQDKQQEEISFNKDGLQSGLNQHEVESKLISESNTIKQIAFPSLQKSLSFKKLEEKLRQSDQHELDRIASIMKQDFSKSIKLYELSSDSD